jgi:hypothetical protein
MLHRDQYIVSPHPKCLGSVSRNGQGSVPTTTLPHEQTANGQRHRIALPGSRNPLVLLLHGWYYGQEQALPAREKQVPLVDGDVGGAGR